MRSLTSSERPQRASAREVVRSGAATAGAGLWLALSPWVLNYRADNATVLAVVLGLVVAILALAGTRPDGATRWLGWLNVAIGASVVLLAFVATDSRRGLWSFLITGVAVLATSAWSTSGGPTARDQAPPR